MRIVIVEDNKALAQGVAHQLRDAGHAVNLLHDGAEGLNFIMQEGADIVVLDINLPSLDGLSIVKGLRRAGNAVPIILLTARGEIRDRVAGLDAGADDYLVKPFEMEELDARIRALIRRKPREDGNLADLGQLTWDRSARRLMADGQDIDLPRRELGLFECLFERQGQIVSKAQIADHIYGTGTDIEEKVVEVYVSRLRKKLAPYGPRIKVARGLGYMMMLET